jgi:hypothetical protein
VAAAQERHDRLAADLEVAAAAGDHGRLRELGDQLATVGVELADAEEAWLELAAAVEERGLRVD